MFRKARLSRKYKPFIIKFPIKCKVIILILCIMVFLINLNQLNYFIFLIVIKYNNYTNIIIRSFLYSMIC